MLIDIEELAVKYCNGIYEGVWLIQTELVDFDQTYIKSELVCLSDFKHALATLNKFKNDKVFYMKKYLVRERHTRNEIRYDITGKFYCDSCCITLNILRRPIKL